MAFQQQLAQLTAENAALLKAWEEEDRLREADAIGRRFQPRAKGDILLNGRHRYERHFHCATIVR